MCLAPHAPMAHSARNTRRAPRAAAIRYDRLVRIKRIHHITLAVRDVDGARMTFEQLFGERGGERYAIPAFGVRAIDVPLGEATLQLAAATDADNPLRRFIDRRGEGVYTIALEVDDLDGAVAELAARGVRVSEPVESGPGQRSAFVAMAATHGMSVQLVEVTPEAGHRAWTPPATASASSVAPAPAPAPGTAPHPAARAADDWSDTARRDELNEPAPKQPLDLTPDEWSDVD
jgi:methylmalonyl-CoA epimerase